MGKFRMKNNKNRKNDNLLTMMNFPENGYPAVLKSIRQTEPPSLLNIGI